MFQTLVCQYLNKRSESKIGDFASPEAFHAVKVQRLGRNKGKPSAEVRGKFEMPISALVGDMPIKSRELTDSTPPIARPFHFTRSAFGEFAEFSQGLFQKLRVLDFFASVECQIGIHTEVCAYAFTCSGQHFFRRVICHDIEPIRSNTITKDLEITDVPVPIAMLMERKPAFIELESLRRFVPCFERQANFTCFKFVSCFELRRAIFATFLELRTAHMGKVKKSFPSDMQADNHLVKCIARYPYPMFMGAFEQLREVRLQPITPRIFAIDTVIAVFQLQKMVMDIAKVIKHITYAHILRMLAYLVFIGSTLAFLFTLAFFHKGSQLTALTPNQWVGRHVTLRLR